jgi:hypothetical protein
LIAPDILYLIKKAEKRISSLYMLYESNKQKKGIYKILTIGGEKIKKNKKVCD